MSWQSGQTLIPLVKPPITSEQLRQYATVSGDYNPIHLDENFAKEAGFDSVIAHGMLSMAFLADYIVHSFPEDKYKILKFKCRFRKVTFPGDTLTCEGHVQEVDPSGRLTIQIWTKSQKAEVTTEGEAIVSPV